MRRRIEPGACTFGNHRLLRNSIWEAPRSFLWRISAPARRGFLATRPRAAASPAAINSEVFSKSSHRKSFTTGSNNDIGGAPPFQVRVPLQDGEGKTDHIHDARRLPVIGGLEEYGDHDRQRPICARHRPGPARPENHPHNMRPSSSTGTNIPGYAQEARSAGPSGPRVK